MKKIFAIIFLFGLLFSINSQAQLIKLSDKPEEFIVDMQKVMATDNNAVAIEMGKKFENYWNTKFDQSQKAKLINLCRKMSTRGYKMAHYYVLFEDFDIAIQKEGFTNEKFNNLIDYLQKSVDAYDLKTGTGILNGINSFFTKRILYTANYNRLYALGGTYDFTFIEKAAPAAGTTSPNQPAKVEDGKYFDGWDTEPADSNAVTPDVLPKAAEIPKKPMPIIVGFSIKLNDVDLVIATSSDSVSVKKTTGTVSLKDGLYVGKGGQMTWEAANLPNVYATFTDFAFEIRNPRFSADDVTIYYSDRLNKPLQGVFEYKSEKRNKGVPPSYPRFMSYYGDAIVKNIDKSIEYKGGFSMSGRKIYSSALLNKYSNITVKRDGKFFFKANSTRFELGDSVITSPMAGFVTYIEKDSITHPAVKLNYDFKNFQLRLNKVNSGGFRDTPFSDSYHQMDIRCDALRWNLNTGKMDFYILSGRGVVPAVFESQDFFDARRVTDLSGSAGFNPLILVGNFIRNKNKTTFSVYELSQASRIPAKNLEGGLIVAVQQGYLSYEPQNDIYKMTRKGEHYLAAFQGRRDFDDFLIPSLFSGRDSASNATLSLNDKGLTVRGIKRFNLSDSLGIYALPYDQTIKINKNRTFSFSGQLKVKNYRFAGKELEVDYDKFTVALNKIDSITFTPISIYRKGGRGEIGSHIKFFKPGTLYLNRPDNKSGKTYLPEYPRLKIDEGVIVYFDEPARGDRKYARSVYFDVPKIDQDSLNIKDIEFDGTFYSGNIFKPFKEVLRTMPDTTLGFMHKVPNGSYKVFGDESSIKFAADLVMDGKGLHSEGDINHLAATLTAKEILFKTESLTAVGQLGEIKESTLKNGAYFPQVDIRDYNLSWRPLVDSMIVATKGGFNFYSGTSSLKGELVVRKGGLFGIGRLIRTDSETASNQFKFNKEGFTADQSQFNVKSTVSSAKPVLLGKNVDVNFNVSNSIVNIAINEGNFNDTTSSSFDFPYAAYKTNIDRVEWNIKDKKISMKGDVEKSLFTSTNPSQEGLAFNGGSAVYNIDQMTLNISSVPFIKSADAKIIPDKGEVSIRRDADMQAFKNARLTIDTLNGYHNLKNGNIQIVSRTKFSGDATYQFVNVRKDTFNIKMGNFELREIDEAGELKKAKGGLKSTVARAEVSERDSVFLSPKMLYKGQITMLAPIKNLSLDGFVIPALRKYPTLGGYWITYKGNKSEEITINVDKNLKSGNSPIFAGLHLKQTASSNGMYPTFLSAKDSPDDENIFLANGTFRRDEPNKLFSIIPPKDDAKNLEGNKYELLDEKGIIKLEGAFNLLGGKQAQYLQTSGFAKVRLDTPKHEFNTMMVFNFPIAPPLLLNMGDKVVKTNLDLGVNEAAIQFDNPEFMSKMAQFVGDKEVNEYRLKTAREHLPLFKLSPKFNASMVFSDLKLQWNPQYNTFSSVGKLGMSNIGEMDINARIEGYVEVIKNPIAGDEMYVFIELSGENWYYLGYKEGQMGLISSDDAFNNLISAKDKSKKSKDYSVIAVDFAEAIQFRNNFLAKYRGIKPDPKKTTASGKPLATEVNKKLTEVPKTAEAKPAEKKKEEKKKEEEKEGF
ncbi:MAG: hypothetical protein MUF45_10170 [Spirosomaceae bacterium]|jgi:hypothetical protein|nr:hypothetical protein [Spirosomataceae bacterium]